MRQTREVLRQKLALKKSHREVARSLAISVGSVGNTMVRAKAIGLDWAMVQQLSEAELESRLYGEVSAASGSRPPLPDPAYLHQEMRRPGVTLELLHLEYLAQHPDGYRYTQFCEGYRQWVKRSKPSMRQVHRAGEKCFVDYSGKKPHIVDPKTGECIEVELFVAVLGASSYTYAEASRTQQGPEWIASHVRAFAYFGGVTGAVVPDQLKSGVTLACRYEPGIQRTYEEMATHYGTTILPARPAKPKDKSKVEVGVQVVQRWILARLRNHTFFSLAELNSAIWALLDDLNGRVMRDYRKSRRQLFEELDKSVLRQLPSEPFVYGEWKKVKVNIDYHVEVDHHFYSVPHRLIHEQLESRASAMTVEIYQRGERIASHLRSYKGGGFTTVAEHMPKAHQKHLEWTPSRLIHWAASIGPNVQALVEAILTERRHPEAGYRSCLGILRLSKRYPDRIDAACQRAVAIRVRSYRSVDSILKNGLDRLPLPVVAPEQPPLPLHENVRGPSYYH